MLSGLTKLVPTKNVEVATVGPITVRVHRPVGADMRPAMLWIHGGGYVMGNAAQDDAVCRHFAETLGIVVAAVDYRLAPEAQFPVPLQDCYESLTWLADRNYVDATRLAVGTTVVALIFSFLSRSQDLVTATLAICCVLLLSARRVMAASRRWTCLLYTSPSPRD